MDNKLKNEIIPLIIVSIVSVIGFFLIVWFYSIIASEKIPTLPKTTLTINNEVLNKVTQANNDSAPLLLEDQDFGRENPFGNLK
jgi:hypothetical protein